VLERLHMGRPLPPLYEAGKEFNWARELRASAKAFEHAHHNAFLGANPKHPRRLSNTAE
jgi:hypothetical protein